MRAKRARCASEASPLSQQLQQLKIQLQQLKIQLQQQLYCTGASNDERLLLKVQLGPRPWAQGPCERSELRCASEASPLSQQLQQLKIQLQQLKNQLQQLKIQLQQLKNNYNSNYIIQEFPSNERLLLKVQLGPGP